MALGKDRSTGKVDIELKYEALDRPYQDVEFLCEYLKSNRSADFFRNFVILPRNLKSRGARFASYSTKLRITMEHIMSGNTQMGVLDDVVTQSNLYPDHTGWLVDQRTGRRRWCVIADMLLCVFETRQSEKPLKVIMLPGHKVKAMLFSSAKQDTLIKTTCSYEERSGEQLLTISGIQKHQFTIYSADSGERLMFGADSKDVIDKWVAMVTVATNLSKDLFTDSDDGSNTDSGYVPSSFGEKRGTSHSRESSPSNSFKEPRGKRTESESDCSKSETFIPLNACKNCDEQENSDNLAFSKVKRATSFGSENDLTSDKKKLKSGKPSHSQIPQGGRKLVRTRSWSMGSQESLISNNSQLSTWSIESKNSMDSFSRFKALWTRNAVKTIDLNGKDNVDSCETTTSDSKQAMTRSLEERIKSIPLPASITSALLTRRTSTDNIDADYKELAKSRSKSSTGSFRAKMFSAKYRYKHESTALGDHLDGDVKISGWLLYKQLLKWSKLFCVVSKSYFYGYRSDYPSETPDVVLPLCECSVHELEGDKQRRHSFKICHLNAKSTYLAAPDSFELGAWISVLKLETKGWKDACALMKSHTSVDSLMSNISKSSLDSFNSNSSIGSLASSNQSFTNSEPTSEKSADVNVTNASDYDTEDGSTDGFGFIVGESRGRTSHWQPPCPAHGLDTSTSSSSGILYEACTRGNSSFTPSMSSADCSMEVPESSVEPEMQSSPVSKCPEAVYSVAGSDRTSMTSSCSCSCSSPSECVCDEIRDETLSQCIGLPTKYSSPSKYDANLKQVWKNDRNYQLQLLKSRVSVLPDKPEIFNVHLPGPNNEGLLLVNDETTEIGLSPVKHGKSVQQKVHPSPSVRTVRVEKCGTEVVVAIPAREVSSPTISGYLDRRLPDGTWKSCWYILKDSTLYRYGSPIDDLTENVLQLPGYTVKCSEASPNTFIVTLEHQECDGEILRTESEAEFSSWKSQLEAVTRKDSVVADENDNIQKKSAMPDQKEIAQVKKEELLRELLQQKQDIEKKRAYRPSQVEPGNIVSSIDSLQVPESDTLSSLQSDNVFKQLTNLKQRKFSTQLKVQSLQKQLQEKHKEQKGFKFGRKAASVKVESKTVSHEALERKHSGPFSTDEGHIHHQLQNLTSELHNLDQQLDKMQRSAAITIGLTTPELLTNLEKRRQLSRKKISESQKSFDSSSSEGDLSSDFTQTLDRKISKSSVLKLHRSNISGSLFKKTPMEKKTKNTLSVDNNNKGENGRRPSWEQPWRNSWDATKSPLKNASDKHITQSTFTLNDIPRNRLMQQGADAKWKSRSYKVLSTQNAPVKDQRLSVRENIQSTRNEINPAALAEIAAFEELIREKMGTS